MSNETPTTHTKEMPPSADPSPVPETPGNRSGSSSLILPSITADDIGSWSAPVSSLAGPARTAEGGIFFSISGIKTFRECPQKYLNSRVYGLQKEVTEDYFILGGLYGAGTAEWLASQSLSKVVDAIAQEMASRVPNPKSLMPEERQMMERIETIAVKWSRCYAETYPKIEWEVVKNEWGFAVSVGVHKFVGFVDTFWRRKAIKSKGVMSLPGPPAFREAKTTKDRDILAFLSQFDMNDQILGYSWAFQQKTGEKMVETVLDICKKPGTQNPFTRGWEKFRSAEPEFQMHNLTPKQSHIDLWPHQAQVTADRITWLLEVDPDGGKGMWVRNLDACFGKFNSQRCAFFEVCMNQDQEGLVRRKPSVTEEPEKMLKEGRDLKNQFLNVK